MERRSSSVSTLLVVSGAPYRLEDCLRTGNCECTMDSERQDPSISHGRLTNGSNSSEGNEESEGQSVVVVNGVHGKPESSRRNDASTTSGGRRTGCDCDIWLENQVQILSNQISKIDESVSKLSDKIDSLLVAPNLTVLSRIDALESNMSNTVQNLQDASSEMYVDLNEKITNDSEKLNSAVDMVNNMCTYMFQTNKKVSQDIDIMAKRVEESSGKLNGHLDDSLCVSKEYLERSQSNHEVLVGEIEHLKTVLQSIQEGTSCINNSARVPAVLNSALELDSYPEGPFNEDTDGTDQIEPHPASAAIWSSSESLSRLEISEVQNDTGDSQYGMYATALEKMTPSHNSDGDKEKSEHEGLHEPDRDEIPHGDLVEDTDLQTRDAHYREQVAFTEWINTCLNGDPTLNEMLPLDHTELLTKVKDGILLCKLLNHSYPGLIDDRAINMENPMKKKQKNQNFTLALNSAAAVGCNTAGITVADLTVGKPEKVIDLLWQIIRMGLIQHVNLQDCPELTELMGANEDIDCLISLSPEELLLRWVNYHLARARSTRICTNFTSDIIDSEIYIHLLRQIDGKVAEPAEILKHKSAMVRAEMVLKEAEKLNCRNFLTTAEGIVRGAPKLNFAFVANLFNHRTGLGVPDIPAMEEIFSTIDFESLAEERMYINWINSVGANPQVHSLSDLTNGLVFLHLLDNIRPGVVTWSRIEMKFVGKGNMVKQYPGRQNCNYAVEIARKELGLSVSEISGDDLNRCETQPTLTFLSQLLLAYTLSSLPDFTRYTQEVEIIAWVNKKLSESEDTASSINLQAFDLSKVDVIINLIHAIMPGAISFGNVACGRMEEHVLANANYAISSARKIGVQFYGRALDIAKGKKKMIMAACVGLLAVDLAKSRPQSVRKRQPRKLTI